MRTIVKTNDGSTCELVQKIEAADESLRVSFSGLTLTQVMPELERSLSALGLGLPHATVHEWAQRICEREDYALVL